jgi:hypothetical protein
MSRLTSVAEADGEVVWSGRPSGWCLVLEKQRFSGKTVTTKSNLAGESTYKP